MTDENRRDRRPTEVSGRVLVTVLLGGVLIVVFVALVLVLGSR